MISVELLLVLHALATTIAYGAWAVACGFSLLYLWKHFLAARAFFPSLEVSSEAIDEISGRALAIGFVSLVVGLMLGAWWAYLHSGRYWDWDFRRAWSLVAGLLYAALLHARTLPGRSRWRLALISVLSFVVALLAFLPTAPGT